MKNSDYTEQLIKVAEINNEIVKSSVTFDENTKEAFINLSNWVRKITLEDKKWSLMKAKSLVNNILTYWNESVSLDTELFWEQMTENGIVFERKEPLKFALEKGRFMRVDIGFSARSSWEELRELKLIQSRFSKNEIEKIDNIIINDEETRFNILKKCLTNGRVPESQYLKFGECIAYFKHCDLFEKYFTQMEIESLYHIWR